MTRIGLILAEYALLISANPRSIRVISVPFFY